ncbi:MAG: pseudouridine synthase [Rickettsiaceae bacterium]
MISHVVNSELRTRLDKYLKRIYPNLPQSIIERGIRKKHIQVNNNKVKAHTRVVSGDLLKIYNGFHFFAIDDANNTATKKLYSDKIIDLSKDVLGKYLIYEDQNLIAINKPSGIATQGGSKISVSIDHAIAYLNSVNDTQYKLVHRLDKDTSGVLLISKSYISACKLASAFKSRDITKKYIAVIYGKLQQKYGTVETHNEKNQKSITHYKTLQHIANNNIHLIEFHPITGRNHQIRLHVLEIGCYILGDRKYGEHNDYYHDSQMLLHAQKLIIPKQIFEKDQISIIANLPEYFNLEFCNEINAKIDKR